MVWRCACGRRASSFNRAASVDDGIPHMYAEPRRGSLSVRCTGADAVSRAAYGPHNRTNALASHVVPTKSA